MQVTVLYVGSSLLAPLKNAEREINGEYKLDLRLAAHNFGAPLNQLEWTEVDNDLAASDVVFVIHVMDGENALRLASTLERYKKRHHAVVVINCMPELMRQTRMGKLDLSRVLRTSRKIAEEQSQAAGKRRRGDAGRKSASQVLGLLGSVGSWVGSQARLHGSNGGSNKGRHGRGQYLKLVDKLPIILRFVPTAGTLTDVKHYLYLFCYFLQPTPANIRSMVLYAIKQYVPDARLQMTKLKVPQPERMPSVAIYHPDAPKLFETFEAYREVVRRRASKVQSPKSKIRAAGSRCRIYHGPPINATTGGKQNNQVITTL